MRDGRRVPAPSPGEARRVPIGESAGQQGVGVTDMTVERINRPEPHLHPVWRALLYLFLLAMLSGMGAYALALFERWVPDRMQRAIPQLPDTDFRSAAIDLEYVWMFTGATLLATAIRSEEHTSELQSL